MQDKIKAIDQQISLYNNQAINLVKNGKGSDMNQINTFVLKVAELNRKKRFIQNQIQKT